MKEKIEVQKKVSRNIGLDWLRGACALSIMCYHFFISILHTDFLYKIGLYGVSFFFILSGLSMALVYNSFFKDLKSVVNYYVKRVFRIAPLHIVVCVMFAVYAYYYHGSFDLEKFMMNVSLLFSFFDYDNYIARGAWSIGNEMVYYLLTPLFIAAYDHKRFLGNILFLFSVILGAYFAYFLIDSDLPLSKQWSTYINPFNNLFLYVSGIAIYYNLSTKEFSNIILIGGFILTLSVFVFVPFTDQIGIATGNLRFLYCALSILFVIIFYKYRTNKIKLIGKAFEQFGIATYGVYLLHSVVFMYLKKIIPLSSMFVTITSVVITIMLALMSYYWFETRIARLGKKFQLK